MFSLFNNQNDNKPLDNKVEVNATNNFEIVQKARQDLVGEIQAIIEYDNHLHFTTDRVARDTWENIKKEELNHVGELLGLLNYLDPSQKQYVEDGLNEFTDILKNTNMKY